MNAPLRLFVNLSLKAPAPRWLACVCGAALLAGCGTSNPFATAGVDPASPVAADVEKMAHADKTFPTFADIPNIPTDQRPLRQWGGDADQLELAGAKLVRETAPNTWTLNDTQAFATRGRSQAGPALQGDTSSTAATEAFARQIRERATPPPPPR
jgi:hypothetical protein